MKPVKKILSIVSIILIISGISLCLIVYFPKSLGFSELTVFLIAEGQGSKEIAHNLQREGLIRWASLFRGYVYIKGVAGKLQAGEYSLSPAMTVPEIVEKFVSGDVIKEEITIIEGWNLKDIAFYLEKKGISNQEEFLKVANEDFSEEFAFLKNKPKKSGVEGYLFPDTYKIIKGDSVGKIVEKLLQNFDEKLTKDLREEIAKQEKTIFEIITMAGIIEKEVKTKEDKEIVSGIFWKRIEEKKPLQSCATIAYIKGENQWQYSYEDTRIKSPYNTYLNLGLPLGPISNPGIDSIRAAIFPKETDYNYFLTDPETEKTIFSKTYEEHNINKTKYLK